MTPQVVQGWKERQQEEEVELKGKARQNGHAV